MKTLNTYIAIIVMLLAVITASASVFFAFSGNEAGFWLAFIEMISFTAIGLIATYAE
jgi:general stress protein CsbA